MHRMPVPALALIVLLVATTAVARAADDIDFTRPPTEGELDDLTRQAGAALFAAKLAPAEGLGAPVHVEIQAGAVGTRIDGDERFWRIATDGDARASTLYAGRGVVRVGVPAGIDLAAFFERLPGTNGKVTGGEIKWAFVKGGNAVPAVAVRLMHARLSGVDSLELKATGLDVSISKGLGPITPYGGVGRLWLDSDVRDVSGFPGIRVKSSPGANQVFVGARLSAGWFRFTVEGQRAAGLTSYAAALGFKFP